MILMIIVKIMIIIKIMLMIVGGGGRGVRTSRFPYLALSLPVPVAAGSRLDLPQNNCERASENEGRSPETRAKVDLFRLRNIEFNLHIVGAKKLGVMQTQLLVYENKTDWFVTKGSVSFKNAL